MARVRIEVWREFRVVCELCALNWPDWNGDVFSETKEGAKQWRSEHVRSKEHRIALRQAKGAAPAQEDTRQ